MKLFKGSAIKYLLTSNKFTLRCVAPDHCFKTEDRSMVLLRNIVYSEDNIVISNM